jgi:chemosensory pili system protein ChpA (sensor histidine kinase/response regulator)
MLHELRTLKENADSMLKDQSQLARDAQTHLLRTRMEPIRAISPRLHRTLREVATSQNKTVELAIECEELELDKTILDGIVDPLMHLLRNSVDHGIEAPHLRRAVGKPSKARVCISGSHHGTQAVLRISDDGKGLDLLKIREVAVASGYVDAHVAASLAPRDLLSYIFLPGFSTSSNVTEFSGRGVGMDSVRNKIRDLQGSIEVESTAGQGTTFTIFLPMTLAVTRALIVAVGDQVFAIPTRAVDRIAKVKSDQIDWNEKEPSICIDGKETTVFRILSRPGRVPSSPSSDRTVTVIMLRSRERDAAVCVDAIVSSDDIVIKALNHHLRGVRGLIGATLLGDGSVVPIIDPMAVVRSPDSKINHGAAGMTSPCRSTCDTLTVMSVDDSVSVRRVMKAMIEYAGWTAVTAKDGVDALDKLATFQQPPDIVLLDVEMPRMDGFELLSRLREQPDFADTPIVMITSRSGEKHHEEAIRRGATDYAVKPIQSETLTDLIRKHVVRS